MENNQEIIDSAELNMMSAISHLETELAKIVLTFHDHFTKVSVCP